MYAKTVKVWLLLFGLLAITAGFITQAPATTGEVSAPFAVETFLHPLSALVTYTIILLVGGFGMLYIAMVFVLKKDL